MGMMLEINLFDENFRHSPFSTAYQSTDKMTWIRDRMIWDGITVFTDAYIHSTIVQEVQSPVRVGWLHEPDCLHPVNYQAAGDPSVYERFDYILTYYQPLLAHPSSKFRFCPYGGVWVPETEWGIHPKLKRISMLYGAKQATEGHCLRHAITAHLGDRYGIDYYGFQGTPVNYSWRTKVQALKDYQFSIVVETCREANLFTEILCDCLAQGTIPIFWGCPNVSEYFDPRGILSFENVYQLEALLRELDDHTYAELLVYARENLRRVKAYRITEEWLFSHYFSELLV